MTHTTLQIKPAGLQGGDLLGGKFRILREIGEGGFAVVYEAVHVSLGYRAAIKLLKHREDEEVSEQVRERFLREARLMAQLAHPDLVHLYDYGLTASGQPYIVMEFLSGHTLSMELWHHGPMAPMRAHRLMCRALHALELAHRSGVIHRDLKPSNLFLRYVGEPVESLCILDFGIAYIQQETRLTRTGEYIGTPEYSSPEYVRARQVSPALDVYQMGLIFIEMLTGRPVVDVEQPLQALFAHCNGYVAVPVALRVPGLEQVLERAIAVDTSRRFPNAAAFREALEALDEATMTSIDVGKKEPRLATTLDASSAQVIEWAKTLGTDFDTIDFENSALMESRSTATSWDEMFTAPRGAEQPRIDLQLEEPILPIEPTSRILAHTEPVFSEPSSFGMPRLIVAAAVVLLAGLALGYLASTFSGERDTGEVEVAARQTSPADSDASARAEAEEVTEEHVVAITTSPTGAAVYVGEVLLGTSPLDVTVPDEKIVVLRFELEEHADRQIAIDRRTSASLEITLDQVDASGVDDAVVQREGEASARSERVQKVASSAPEKSTRTTTTRAKPAPRADAKNEQPKPAKTKPEESEGKDFVTVDGKRIPLF